MHRTPSVSHHPQQSAPQHGPQFVFDVREDVPELQLRAGDRLVVTYGAAWSVTVLRALPPNYGRILGLHEAGAIESVDGAHGVSDQMQRWAALQAAESRPRLVR
jgi:hypothetical protein